MKYDTEYLWFIAYKQHESVSECWLTVLPIFAPFMNSSTI